MAIRNDFRKDDEMKPEARALRTAHEEGRICSNCGWIVSRKNWKKGFRLCPSCHYALQGVRTNRGSHAALDEAKDKTGDM